MSSNVNDWQSDFDKWQEEEDRRMEAQEKYEEKKRNIEKITKTLDRNNSKIEDILVRLCENFNIDVSDIVNRDDESSYEYFYLSSDDDY